MPVPELGLVTQGHPFLPVECPALGEVAPWARHPEPPRLSTNLLCGPSCPPQPEGS